MDLATWRVYDFIVGESRSISPRCSLRNDHANFKIVKDKKVAFIVSISHSH